jgi:predicted small integral membrane protein
MDAGIEVPGTGIRFGLDPIIGLIPGAGDAAGAVLAGWILLEAARRGVPRATLIRMAYNIAVDALVGAIPLLGDVFDVVWKSNLRNVELLERQALSPNVARRADRLFLALLGGGLLILFGGLAAAGVWLFSRVLG